MRLSCILDFVKTSLILKPQLYKVVIMQQNNSTEESPQEKKEELPRRIDEGSSMKIGFGSFQYFTFFILKFQYCGNIK